MAYKRNKKVCGNCKFWNGDREAHKNRVGEWSNVMGSCDGMVPSDKVEVDLAIGWDGSYVESVNTESDFGCILFEKVVDMDTKV